MKSPAYANPGATSAGDEHCDPHGHGVGSPSEGGHVGMGRDGAGGFAGQTGTGGVSPDGEQMIAKYKPRPAAQPMQEADDAGDDDWM